MKQQFRRLIAAVFGIAVVTAALSGTSVATTTDGSPPTEPTAEDSAAPEAMLSAMQRDLGLSADQARARLALESQARTLEQALAQRLGDQFAGAWLTAESERVIAAVTDPALAPRVRAAGAEPRVVPRGLHELNAAKARLDAQESPRSIRGWYVDPRGNDIVVKHHPSAAEQARAFVDSASVDRGWVRFVASVDSPRLLYDVRGGDAYHIGGGTRCSVGFSVERGFVTAGHCGQPGSSTTGSNGAAQGTFQGSSFPGNDYAWVEVNSDWTPRGVVNDYSGGTVSVDGSQEATVGASICRSGSTTGWHCGTVQAKNQSVNYQQGTVRGLTQTTVCAEPGDSGGSYISGNQAQGVTSGGSGDCTSGGTTYFQPLNEILSAYGLNLVTGNGDDPPPQPPPEDCTGIPTWDTATTYQTGDRVAHDGHEWEATFPNSGAEPGEPTSWAVWQDNGAC